MKEEMAKQMAETIMKIFYDIDINDFGQEFRMFRRSFELPDELISEFFTDAEYKSIIEAKRAKDLDKELLKRIKIFLNNYNPILEQYPECFESGLIVKIINEIHEVLNIEPITLEKKESCKTDLDKIDLNKPAIYIDDDNHVDVSEKYVVNWSPWPFDADTYAFGCNIVMEMIINEQLTGKSYIQVMSTELGVNAFDYNQELDSDIDFDLVSINTPELEKVKDYYMSRISIKDLSRYDNIICVIEDDPNYSGSGKEYKTNTILITSKDKSYIINIAFSREKSYLSPEEESEIVKKITKRQFIS